MAAAASRRTAVSGTAQVECFQGPLRQGPSLHFHLKGALQRVPRNPPRKTVLVAAGAGLVASKAQDICIYIYTDMYVHMYVYII